MKFYLIITILFLSFSTTKAQLINDILDPTQQNQDLIYGKKYNDIDGSPFLIEEWVKGTIVDNLDKKHENIEIKYHAYEDKLMIKKDEEGELILSKSLVKEFYFYHNQEEYVFKLVRLSETSNLQYLREIYNGKNSLYEKREKKLVKTGRVENGYASSRQVKDRFVESEALYIKKGEEGMVEIKRSKKDFIAYFEDFENEIKDFLKENKISFKDTKDLKELMSFIDSLQQQ